MKILKLTLIFILCLPTVILNAQDINWDFEDGNDHGFTLRCLNPATPAADDPTTAGDEAITGVGGTNGLPDAGVAWSIGSPDQFNGLKPAVNEGCHVDGGGLLVFGPCNDPFGVAVGEPPYDFENSRGQSGYLNTYDLSQWGDNLHSAANDQIATSLPVLLSNGAELTVWSTGGPSETVAPALEADPANGYVDWSSGIAVLSAADSSLLANVCTQNPNELVDGVLIEYTLDLSAFAGQTVIIEVVDAFQGPWGWIAVDEIQITKASLATGVEDMIRPAQFALAQNYPNPFKGSTHIPYTLDKNSNVELYVYDVCGQKIATLVNQFQTAGSYNVTWDASRVNSGIYFYSMKVDNHVVSKRMTLIK